MKNKITGEKHLCTERPGDKEVIHTEAEVMKDQREDCDLGAKFSDRKLTDDVKEPKLRTPNNLLSLICQKVVSKPPSEVYFLSYYSTPLSQVLPNLSSTLNLFLSSFPRCSLLKLTLLVKSPLPLEYLPIIISIVHNSFLLSFLMFPYSFSAF